MPIQINGKTITKVNVVKDGVTQPIDIVKMSTGEIVFKNKVPMSVVVDLIMKSYFGGAEYYLKCRATIPQGSGASITVSADQKVPGATSSYTFTENDLNKEFFIGDSNQSISYPVPITVYTSFGDSSSVAVEVKKHYNFNFPA